MILKPVAIFIESWMMLMKIILVIYTASEIMNLNILLDKPMKGHLNNVKLVSHDLRSGRKRKEGEKRNKKKETDTVYGTSYKNI